MQFDDTHDNFDPDRKHEDWESEYKKDIQLYAKLLTGVTRALDLDNIYDMPDHEAQNIVDITAIVVHMVEQGHSFGEALDELDNEQVYLLGTVFPLFTELMEGIIHKQRVKDSLPQN